MSNRCYIAQWRSTLTTTQRSTRRRPWTMMRSGSWTTLPSSGLRRGLQDGTRTNKFLSVAAAAGKPSSDTPQIRWRRTRARTCADGHCRCSTTRWSFVLWRTSTTTCSGGDLVLRGLFGESFKRWLAAPGSIAVLPAAAPTD